MNYRYNGPTCAFAKTGDVFELAKSGKGYLHFYSADHKQYTCLPKDMVEKSEHFCGLKDVADDQVNAFIDDLFAFIKDVQQNETTCDCQSLALDCVVDFVSYKYDVKRSK